MKYILLLAAIVGLAHATLGVDVSQNWHVGVFQCLKSNGYNFAVIRAGCSTGKPDEQSPHTVYNAWEGGMAHVDVYHFPCPKCGGYKNQVDAMIDNLAKYNAKYGMVWLDIEEASLWMDQGTNRNIFNQLVAALQARGKTIGIYTSKYQWGNIMGDWNGGAHFPLWYSAWNGRADFGDFVPFGGWTKPAIKQYKGDTSVCGADVDLNYY